MASSDRFYLLELSHRPALYGDIGSILKIEGIVIGGEGARMILMLPGTTAEKLQGWAFLSMEEWSDWLQRSDNPEILVNGSLEKAFHRKLRYDISGAVQQKIWAADGFKCMFCGRKMGEVQLTIDHFMPLEMGGENNQSNYLSACRKCNKDKGAHSPVAFCQARNLSYADLVEYLKNRVVK